MRHFEVECWKLPTVGHEDLVRDARSDIIYERLLRPVDGACRKS